MAEHANDKVTLTDHSSGASIDLELRHGTAGPNAIDITPLFHKANLFTYDPGFVLNRQLRQHDHLHRRRRGHPAVPRLPDRAAGRAQRPFIEVAYLLLYGELPTRPQLGRVRPRRHASHACCNETLLHLLQRLPPRRPPDGDDAGVVGSLSAFYHDTMDIHDPEQRAICAHPPDRQAADHRRRRLQALDRPAVLYPRNDLNYGANFLHMMFAVPGEAYDSTRSQPRRWTCCSSCMPTTSRTPRPRRCAWPAVPAPIPTPASPPASRRCGARRTVAPTRPCSKCSKRSARPDNIPKYIDKAKDKDDPLPSDGLRPPRLQELRPARHDHPEICHEVLHDWAERPAVGTGAASWKRSR